MLAGTWLCSCHRRRSVPSSRAMTQSRVTVTWVPSQGANIKPDPNGAPPMWIESGIIVNGVEGAPYPA